jgi:hypothetical protein
MLGSGEDEGREGSSTREVEAMEDGRRREESGERRPSMTGVRGEQRREDVCSERSVVPTTERSWEGLKM